MKNFTQLFSLLCLGTFLLASCSQTKDLAKTETKDNSRMYYKEYIGNKIIYHDKTTDETAEAHVNEEEIASLNPEQEKELQLETQNSLVATPEKLSIEESGTNNRQAAAPAKAKKSKPFLKGFYSNIKKNHNDVVSGKVFTKKYYKEKKAKSSGSAAVGASEIFGLLALIFGAASFTFGIAGLVFGILGLVFGIIGLDADSFWGIFALVGLILGAVGAALSFIFILV